MELYLDLPKVCVGRRALWQFEWMPRSPNISLVPKMKVCTHLYI